MSIRILAPIAAAVLLIFARGAGDATENFKVSTNTVAAVRDGDGR